MEGDWAKTDFIIQKKGKSAFLVQATPLTGRTHQIRVHLAGLGLPLWGDDLYGGPRCLGAYRVPRVMLHAKSLKFPHPISGLEITVEAPLPKDFSQALSNLIG